jgi:SAM-dependent methyltransferase
MNAEFTRLIDEARAQDFSGWDFAFIEGRVELAPQPWDYAARASDLAASATTMVDLGTGGGEILAGLTHRAPLTVGTEAWRPNVPVAAATLREVGAYVVEVEIARDNVMQDADERSGALPFRNGSVDLVIDRHEAFVPKEVARVLASGGTFYTQQVGGENEIEVNRLIGGGEPERSPTLHEYVESLRTSGLDVVDARESHVSKRYLDVGALAYFLKVIPWQAPGFDIDEPDVLRPVHEEIRERGYFETHMHRLLLEARKP